MVKRETHREKTDAFRIAPSTQAAVPTHKMLQLLLHL